MYENGREGGDVFEKREDVIRRTVTGKERCSKREGKVETFSKRGRMS